MLQRWQINIDRLIGDEHGKRKAVSIAAGMKRPSQLSNLLNDPEASPNLKTLQRIADALGVDIAELFSGVASPDAGKNSRTEPQTGVAPPAHARPPVAREDVRQWLEVVLSELFYAVTTMDPARAEDANRVADPAGIRPPHRKHG